VEVVVDSPEWLMGKTFERLLDVFMLCPELEVLEVFSLKGEVDLSVPVQVDSLKLKKLCFEELDRADGFLSLICRAPLLEEINLTVIDNFSKQDIDTLNILLLEGTVFQNLVKFKFHHRASFDVPDGIELVQALEKLAKNMVSFCPRLQDVSIGGLDDLLEASPIPNAMQPIFPYSYSHVPFLDLLKMF